VSATAKAANPATSGPVKGGFAAVESTTRPRKRSAASNSGQERTASTPHEPPESSVAAATARPRKKYQIRTPVESMTLKASRAVTKVILFVVEPTRHNRAQTNSR
jgi:hypothetical protein